MESVNEMINVALSGDRGKLSDGPLEYVFAPSLEVRVTNNFIDCHAYARISTPITIASTCDMNIRGICNSRDCGWLHLHQNFNSRTSIPSP